MNQSKVFSLISIAFSLTIFVWFLSTMGYTLFVMAPITTLSDLFLVLDVQNGLLLSRIISTGLTLRFGLFDSFKEWVDFIYQLIGSLTWIEVAAVVSLPGLYSVKLFMSGVFEDSANRLISLWGDVLAGILLMMTLSIVAAFLLWPYPATLFLVIKILFGLNIFYWLYRLVKDGVQIIKKYRILHR